MMKRVDLPMRFWIRLVRLVILAVGLAGALPAQADEVKKLDLRRGISLSNWFANAQRQPLFDGDFNQIKNAGFDHVRLPINPEFLGFSLTEAATGRILFDFAPIDRAIDLAMANGLAVILDIHPGDGFLSMIQQDARAEAGFIGLWDHIADHYKLYPTNILAFEILNAPKYDEDPAQYGELMADLLSSLRAIVPDHLIIIDAPKSATLDGFAALKPLTDPNVAYAFHFFEPAIFTHQGMNFGPQGRVIRYYRGVPYPSSLADPSINYAPTAPDATETRKALIEYSLADWNDGHIRARLAVAADWAKANHAHIICTEFGARRSFVSASQRYQWIADTRKALEADGIAWDLWDYTDLFGITKFLGNTITEPVDGSVRFVDPEKGSREIEPDAMKALFSQ